MEDVWIMDSGCSRHMTGHRKWFSSLNPISTKEYITFGDNGQGKVMGVGSVSLSAKLSLREVAFVRNLGFNLVSVSQLLDEGFEVRFKKGACCVLDAEETLNGVVERKNRTLVEIARTMLDEHRTPRHFWAEAVNTACYIANRIFLRAFLGKTSYELWFGRQPSVKHLRAFGCRCFVLKKAGHLDKFESRCLDGIFLGYASSSRAFRVWILKAKKVVETGEVSFDETMPCTTPAFELSGDDEEGAPIFEDEEGAVNDGDAGATAPAPAPAPSTMSSDDEGEPLPTASSPLPRQQAHAQAGPAEDAGEVTSEIVPSRQVQRDHPPHRMIGDIHQRITRSSVNSLAFFSHSAYVASFEPRDVSHALSDPNWVNAMHEELENFERNHVWDLVEPPPNCRPIGTKWVFKNKQGEDGMVVRNKARLVAQGFCQKEGIDYEETFATFFLGLQIKQGLEGTFVHQAKYTRDILKKFNMGDSKPMTTPMSTNTALDADEDGKAVDQKEFRGMIGSLLYLTATRPDIQFAVCLCARYQASPRTSHRQAVKRIFRLQVEGVDNALIKGEIESQWTGLIALLV
ncbi:hypothetical protein U9M48_002677 [Paspalum notatum var. saurae]|uniref:Reverse transcriptase Ty1/copia-type domain-containing protein n=1 Tax=Paspalum notatum var. saurae TaxID=547442 RepID=A0AAQ3SJ94_PASNO